MRWRSIEVGAIVFKRRRRQNLSVKTRRVFASTLVALLLCVSSLAAACDLSCGFALFRSDCHSLQIAADETQRAGMTMAGMAMPEMAGQSSTNQRLASSAPQAMPIHAVLADMGACERQSCDQTQVLASKANHTTAAQFETVSAAAGFFHVGSLQAALHEARDGIVPLSPVVHGSLDVRLRL
jgi:hypothetical protein